MTARLASEDLVHLCNWLKQRADMESASRLIPIVDRLTRLLIQIAEKKCSSEADLSESPYLSLAATCGFFCLPH